MLFIISLFALTLLLLFLHPNPKEIQKERKREGVKKQSAKGLSSVQHNGKLSTSSLHLDLCKFLVLLFVIEEKKRGEVPLYCC